MSEIHKALLKLQGVIRGVKKDAKNPHFKSNYATLEQVTDTIRPHMQDCGLVWVQFPGRITDGGIEVTTKIVHADTGEEISGTMEVPLAKRDPQGVGSAVTYGLRYSLMAILGLPPTDDDAEAAIDRNNERHTEPVARVPANQLKKDGAWDKTLAEIDNELLDAKTPKQFREIQAAWIENVKKAGWPQSWVDSLNEEFEKRLEERKRNREQNAGDVATEIINKFNGRVTDERVLSTLEAGE